MQFINWLDYLILPVYIGIIYSIAIRFRDRKYPPGHAWRPYFIPGLTVKIAGAIFIGLVYQYYYGGGDTANFFTHAKIINSSFTDSPTKWFNLIFHLPEWYDADYTSYISQLFWYRTLNNYVTGAVAAGLGIFTFTTFLPTSVLFATLSFTGTWALFRTFAKQYPSITKNVAIATIFIPSTFIWGAGIFKDTLCMFGLGWMIYGSFELLIRRKIAPGSLILTIIGFYLIGLTKLYILVAFIPAFLFWIFFSYSSRIGSGALRFVAGIGVLVVCSAGIFLLSDTLATQLGQYSVENVAKTSTVIREYIFGASGDQGSAYDIGEVDPSLTGMLSKFPQAVNVTLFRPYVWEARKPLVLFNALEATLFLVITLKVIFSVGPRKTLSAIRSDPNILFCLIFTLIFGFAVGISSGNFGALSRYRIPCLPMYGLALMLIYYRYKDPESKLLSFR